MKTIVQRVYENSVKNPERLVCVLENDELTYGELWEKASRLSSYLLEKGVSYGDRVVFQTAYSKWYVIACFAVHLTHAVFVPIDKNSSEDAISSVVEALGAKCVISKFTSALAPLSLEMERLEETLTHIEGNAEFSFPSGEMYADIMFTTGTTGNPKGVVLTHDNLSSTSVTRIHELEIKPDNVGITFVPLNHVAPMRELYLNCYNGSTFIFLDGIMKIGKMFSFMEKYGVTSLYIPPSGISVISRFSKNGLKAVSDRIDYVYSASSGMTEVQQDYMREKLPESRLYFSYGSSENGSVSLHRYQRDKKDVSCVGKPCKDVSVKIVDDNFNEVESGQVGTVCIKSAMNFACYYNNPEATEKVYRDGFFVSNDAGCFDGDGYLYIMGRKDDMVNIGGLKVFPAEIEDAVSKTDGVEDCICVPIPDPVTGQAIKLIIKKENGADIDPVKVKNALSGKIDSYKMPKIIEFADHIERTSNGKLNRKAYK